MGTKRCYYRQACRCQHIIKLLVDNRINDKDVSVCVSATHSIYRVVFVPRLERALMAEAARKEMERVCPVPLDTLYTSWQDIKTSDVEVGLCLLGLPHDNVDSVIDTMTIAGLRLKSLELKPLAVSRVVDEATAIVVNIQANGFDITVLDDGIPELIRSLTFPQTDMPDTEKIAVVKEELARTVNFHNSSRTERQLGNDTACFISGQTQDMVLQDIGYIVKPLPELLTYFSASGAEISYQFRQRFNNITNILQHHTLCLTANETSCIVSKLSFSTAGVMKIYRPDSSSLTTAIFSVSGISACGKVRLRINSGIP